MAFNITPITGVNFDVAGATVPYFISDNNGPTPKLGTMVKGDDGFDYCFVESTATFAADDDVDITTPAFTIADGGGTGEWTVVAAINDDEYGWVKRAVL